MNAGQTCGLRREASRRINVRQSRDSIVELTVATRTAPIEPVFPTGFAAVSRAIVSAAADLVIGVQRAVVGPAGIRTAQDNAWDALQADRARNEARAELTREVAQLVATSPHRRAKTYAF
jgi:hypothetical protein